MNRVWYDEKRDGSVGSAPAYASARSFVKEIIDLYFHDMFKEPEDITPNNFLFYLERLLKYYNLYLISETDIYSALDCIRDYFNREFWGENGEFSVNEYGSYFPDNDKRQIALNFSTMSCWSRFAPLPEDIPFIIECLNPPDDQIEFMHKLFNYFDQFDLVQRYKEIDKRWKVITQQRIEALQKGEPLPIRPMGIELDMCYNKDSIIQSFVDKYCHDLPVKSYKEIDQNIYPIYLEKVLNHYKTGDLTEEEMRDCLIRINRGGLGSMTECKYSENKLMYPLFYFEDTDKRCLALDMMYGWESWRPVLPKDIPFILECLNATKEQLPFMYEKINQYFAQFDKESRKKELKELESGK